MFAAAILNQYDIVFELLTAGTDPTINGKRGLTLKAIISGFPIAPDSEGFKWQAKVIELLKQRGIMVKIGS
jgi:hypothetical protein